jgi:hypothetical protein
VAFITLGHIRRQVLQQAFIHGFQFILIGVLLFFIVG